jgi:hypothetical protein
MSYVNGLLPTECGFALKSLFNSEAPLSSEQQPVFAFSLFLSQGLTFCLGFALDYNPIGVYRYIWSVC